MIQRLIFFISLTFYTFSNSAQVNFSLFPPDPNEPVADFYNSHSASAVTGDIDGDNDLDIIVSGYSVGQTIHVYRNDGNGNFQVDNTNGINAIESGSIAIGDVDGDNDLDLFISGLDGSYFSSELYLNNGLGQFTVVNNTSFSHAYRGKASFADIDNDNDLDLFIAGNNTADLYTNNGLGNFSLVSSTNIVAVSLCDVEFGDVDGDNDLDLFVSGSTNSLGYRTYLYINDGTGGFTLSTGTPLRGVIYSSLDLADVDGDNDIDLFLSGVNNGNWNEIYTNNGSGNFSLVANSGLPSMQTSDSKFMDIDSDGDQDVIIMGEDNQYNSLLRVYKNNGLGIFTLFSSEHYLQRFRNEGEIIVADFNKDSIMDLFSTFETSLMLNDGLGNFNRLHQSYFDELFNGDLVFADFDGDMDQDLIIGGNGSRTSFGHLTKLYRNNGNLTFTEVNNTPFFPAYHNSILAFDIDGDSDKDIVVAGETSGNTPQTRVFRNNGNMNFSVLNNNLIDDVYTSVTSSSDYADVDGDNDLDMMILGYDDVNASTKLYINNGNGIFTPKPNQPFTQFPNGALAFADVDGDNDQDVLITGWHTPTFTNKMELYLNDSTGNFTKVTNTSITARANPSISFGDVDNDNDMDLFVTGGINGNLNSDLYINNGSGSFSLSSQSFMGVRFGESEFKDIDNDLDLDLVIIGSGTSVVYLNNGNGSFTVNNSNSLKEISYGKMDFADVDGDNDQDLLIIGGNKFRHGSGSLYLNNCNNTFTHKIIACQSYTWIDGNTYFSTTDTNTFTISKTNGCDSVIKLDLIITHPTIDTTQINACDSFFWNANNQVYTTNGIFTDTLLSLGGCDSVVSIDLSILSSSRDTVTVQNCDQYLWVLDSTIYTNSGIYSDTLVNSLSCDSIVYLNLTINNSSIDTTLIQACNSYLWSHNSMNYTNSGFYKDTIQSTFGCDSILVLDLSIDAVNLSINKNLDTLLAVENRATYQWLNCSANFSIINGETNQWFRPTTNGTYAVELNYNTCIDTSNCETIVLTGISESYFNNNIQVSPNPVNDEMTIVIPNLGEKQFARIYSINGRIINSFIISNPLSTIDLKSFADGLYFLEIGQERIKFIKN